MSFAPRWPSIVENLYTFAFKYNHISISGEIAISAHRVCGAVWDIVRAEIVEIIARCIMRDPSCQTALASVRGAHPSVFKDDVLCRATLLSLLVR